MPYAWGRTPTPEDTISRLKNELRIARQTILDLVQPNVHDLLDSYYECTSKEKRKYWEIKVFDELVKRVERIPEYLERGEERAWCPLCGCGTLEYYKSGYALPEGLRSHFFGYNNTRKCLVMEQIRLMAKEYWEEEIEKRQNARKRKSEPKTTQ